MENFKCLLNSYSIKEIAEKLNVSKGTIIRWIELNDIPNNYEFEIMKLLNIDIDYSKYSSKQKDQFYTPIETAKKCYQIFIETLKNIGDDSNNYKYIEPSAGNGVFLEILPIDTIAIDIEPKHNSIIKYDYLNWFPNDNNDNKKIKYIVFGNPPFGLRGHLALKFINHSYNFADYVCFILPQLFESEGKGSPRKRIKGYNLIKSIKLESYFYGPSQNKIKINTIFQIWSKNYKNNIYDIKKYNEDKIKIYSLSNGGTVSTTRNKNMIDKCDIYIPSTCFGKNNMKCYLNFNDLPNKRGYGIVFNEDKELMIQKIMNIELHKIAFLSTNSAYNLRCSHIYSLFDI